MPAATAARSDLVAYQAAARPSPSFDPAHPICRGDFPILIFSGCARELSELAGEPTARASYKFALVDPRLEAEHDFARSAAVGLPIWEPDDIEPTEGACFIFADDADPRIERLRALGAQAGNHWAVVGDIREKADRTDRIVQFIRQFASSGLVLILGYGQQGRRIAQVLEQDCQLARQQIAVYDNSADSQARAREDGLELCTDTGIPAGVSAVIYSPLAHHRHLAEIAEFARNLGIAVLDNAQWSGDLERFLRHGEAFFDAAARRGLAIDDRRITLKNPAFALSCTIVREEVRRFGDQEIVHLQGGETHLLCSAEQTIHLAGPAANQQLHPGTHVRTNLTFVGIGRPACVELFAARDLAHRLWPVATQRIMPAMHEVDLGCTEFERLLRNHLDCREIVTTMQTPAQRVALGTAARHYACDRPIIEIGSALGGSALLMAAATVGSSAPIISIDPDTATRDIMRFAFQREGYAGRLRQIVETSQRAALHLKEFAGKAGLVFIDGLHTEAGVLSDYQQFSSMIAPGGAIAFHDVAVQIHSVMRAVLGTVLRDRRFEAVCMVDGLLILQRRGD